MGAGARALYCILPDCQMSSVDHVDPKRICVSIAEGQTPTIYVQMHHLASRQCILKNMGAFPNCSRRAFYVVQSSSGTQTLRVIPQSNLGIADHNNGRFGNLGAGKTPPAWPQAGLIVLEHVQAFPSRPN